MSKLADIISDIRAFNRFYTNILGLMDQHILDSGYSLTEARVLFEISKTERCAANTLVSKLGIDRSYMSRMILKFERKGLITKTASETDSRVNYIPLFSGEIELFRAIIAAVIIIIYKIISGKKISLSDKKKTFLHFLFQVWQWALTGYCFFRHINIQQFQLQH